MKKALDNVLLLLSSYEGGPIEIGAPLHSAVAELELYCKPKRGHMLHAHLFNPAHHVWCRLLRCSRAGNISGAMAECKKLQELLVG